MIVTQSEQVTKLKEELAAPLRVMQEIARRIAKVSKESKLPINEDDYVKSFKVELMDAVVQWCRGASFADICKVRSSAPSRSSDPDILLRDTAHRPVRRFTHSRIPSIAGAYPTDEPSCEGHWEQRVAREVREGQRDARTA